MTNTVKGYISIHNEDGTQWLEFAGDGFRSWSSRQDRQEFSYEIFEQLETEVESSKKNDCPDNGFFGLWNLKWHPVGA